MRFVVGFEQTADGFDAAYRSVEKSMRQTSLGGSLRLARAFGRHRIELGGGYDYLAGQKLLRPTREASRITVRSPAAFKK